MIKSTKGTYGEESALGNVVKILKGAGAIAGITAAIAVYGQLADSVSKLGKKLEDGTAKARDFEEAILSSIPVLSQLYEIGKKVEKNFEPISDETVKTLKTNFQKYAEFKGKVEDATADLITELQSLNKEGFAKIAFDIEAPILKKIEEIKFQAEFLKKTGADPYGDANEAANTYIETLKKVLEKKKEIALAKFTNEKESEWLNSIFEQVAKDNEASKQLKESVKDRLSNLISPIMDKLAELGGKPVMTKETIKQNMGTISAIESRAGSFIPTQATVEYQKQTASNTKTIADVLIKKSVIGNTLSILGIGY